MVCTVGSQEEGCGFRIPEPASVWVSHWNSSSHPQSRDAAQNADWRLKIVCEHQWLLVSLCWPCDYLATWLPGDLERGSTGWEWILLERPATQCASTEAPSFCCSLTDKLDIEQRHFYFYKVHPQVLLKLSQNVNCALSCAHLGSRGLGHGIVLVLHRGDSILKKCVVVMKNKNNKYWGKVQKQENISALLIVRSGRHYTTIYIS